LADLTFTTRFNTTISYSDTGSDIRGTLVFLHGWGCTRETLVSITRPLSNKFRVIAVDLPGFGESEALPDTPGTREYASVIADLTETITDSPAIFAGHSFGGKICIVLAAEYSHLVDRLVLVDASGIKPRRGPRYFWKVFTWKALRFFLTRILQNKDRLERIREKRGSTDYRQAGKMRQTLVRVVNEHFDKALPTINCPVFLYWGEKDPDTPLWMAEKMVKILPDAALYTVKNGGHYSFLDDPSIIRIIEAFANDR
jgi:pimeloyl-ACP methyl ester carboxylesterase